MVKYADIEKQNLGEQAMIQMKANQAIEEEAQSMATENNVMEQRSNDEDRITQEAQSVINQMHEVEANGGDALKVLNGVPENVQVRIAAILKDEAESNNTAGNMQNQQENQSQDMNIKPNDGNMSLSQANDNLAGV